MNTSHRAFSLIELVVVIVVMGLLVTIGSWSYSGYQERARNTARASAAKSYVDILGTMYARNTTVFQKNTGVTDIRFCLGQWFTDINSDGLGDCNVLQSGSADRVSKDATRDTAMRVVVQNLPDSDKTPVVGADGISRIGPYAIIKRTSDGGMPWVRYILEKPGATSCPFGATVWQDAETLICEEAVTVSAAP